MQDLKNRATKRPIPTHPSHKTLKIQTNKGKISISSQRKPAYISFHSIQTARASFAGLPFFFFPMQFIRIWLKPLLGLAILGFMVWVLFGIIWQSFSFFQQLPPYQIHLNGHRSLSPSEIYETTGIRPTMPFNEIDAHQIATNLKQDPRIEQTEVRKLFPHSLFISLEERLPYAYLKSGTSYYLIDRTFHPIKKTKAHEADSYPLFIGVDPALVQLGKPIESYMLLKGAQLLDLLQETSINQSRMAELDVGDPLNLKIKLNTPPVLIQLGQEKYLEKIKTFEKIFTYLQQSGKSLHSIDLRYKNKAIVQF